MLFFILHLVVSRFFQILHPPPFQLYLFFQILATETTLFSGAQIKKKIAHFGDFLRNWAPVLQPRAAFEGCSNLKKKIIVT